MVSHEGFRILGYVYAILSTLGAFCEVIQRAIYIGAVDENETVRHVSMPGSLLALVFSIILLVGIWKNNLTLVKVYRVFLIVSYTLVLGCIAIAILVFIGIGIFSEEKPEGVGVMIFILILVLGIVLGLFLLFLWIVNGVIAAIQSMQTPNGPALYQADEQNKQPKSNPYYAPV